MKVTMTLIGARELQRHLQKMSDDIAMKTKRETYAAGLEVQKIARLRLRGKEGGTKAWKTGFLANSIIVEKLDKGMMVEIGPTAPYGPYIEYGTRKMSARPFLHPAWLAVDEKFLHKIKKILQK